MTTEQQPAPATTHRIFTASLIIGVSGSGKTSLLKTFSEYLWEVHQRILLLYSWDGGAVPTDVQKRMRQGLIRFWRCRTRSAPGLALETLALATKGYWPRLINPATGETDPAVTLVPPVMTKYSLACPKGHPLKIVPAASLITNTVCGPCGNKMITRGEMTITETTARTKGFEAVGGVAYDGLTSMCSVVMDEMDSMRGHGHIGGEKSSFGGTITSGNVKFGGNNRADVGFAQSRARQFVNNSLSIPHLVEGPVFTGLTQEATDEGGLPIVGLNLPGSAAIEDASSWFGNVLEQGKSVDDAGKSHYTLFVRPFTDKDGRKHLLKTSSSPYGLPDRLTDPPEDAKRAFEQANLGLVFKLLDEDLQKALEEDLVGAPGLAAGEMEYGESAAVEVPVSTPAGGSSVPTAAGAGTRTPPPAARPGAPKAQTTTAAVPATQTTTAPAPPVATASASPAPAQAPAPAPRPGSVPARPQAARPPAAQPAATAPQAAVAPPPPAQAQAAPQQKAAPKVVAPPPPGRAPARAPGT